MFKKHKMNPINTKPHQKHAKLSRPSLGFFGRNEWSVIGTPCGNIQQLAFSIIQEMSQQYKVSYVDADHKSADEEAESGKRSDTALAYGARLEYTDKINFHRFDQKAQLDSYQFRSIFNGQDMVLVNGNHFSAQKQIVVIDPKKEKSLEKKLDRLTNVQLILLVDGAAEIYPFLTDHLGAIDHIPILKLKDHQGIIHFLQQKMEAAIPPINGLVLAGGKSQRMGVDKGLINYHGKPQREYAVELLQSFCEQTFLSCRPEQLAEMGDDLPVLTDTISGLGPFGAILSAFREYPDHAWLVIACDLPLLDEATIKQLINSRDSSRFATAFNSPVNEFPEPLIAIWEPRSYSVLFQFLAQGYSCPRKVLINSDVHLLDAGRPETLSNVNRPEEKEEILKVIGKG